MRSVHTDAAINGLRDPVVLLRAFYLAASALILVIQAVPALRRRFLAYGPRATAPAAKAPKSPGPDQVPSRLARLLDSAASFTVPHSYFTHFYVVSVASSIFWGWRLQLWKSHGQLQVVWALMLLQGVRRLLESYAYTSTSKSRMWVAHWILGLLFYLATNVAVWIEELPSSVTPEQADLRSKTTSIVPAILIAHFQQHAYHAYLYRLRTEHADYQLPFLDVFPYVLCPHYTVEVTIYLYMSLLASPPGRTVNLTLACATLFVAVNLGVTAAGTKAWYAEKFGADKVSGRKRLVPYIW